MISNIYFSRIILSIFSFCSVLYSVIGLIILKHFLKKRLIQKGKELGYEKDEILYLYKKYKK
jgi:hypothetical protein